MLNSILSNLSLGILIAGVLITSTASAASLKEASQFFIFQYSPTPTGNSEIQNATFIGDVGLASTTKRLVFSNVLMTGDVYRVNSGIHTGVPTDGEIIEDPLRISNVSDQIHEVWIGLWNLESDEALGDVDHAGDLLLDYSGTADREIVVDALFFRHTDGTLTIRADPDDNIVFRVKDGLELGRSDIILDGIDASRLIIAAGDPSNTVDGAVKVKMDYGTWRGTLFAPYALAELNNLSGFIGMVIAEEIKLRGEDDDVIISHVVPPILKNNQTITTFTPLSGTAFAATDTTNILAEASSKLPVSLSVIEGPGQLTGNILSFSGEGTVKIEATQPGNADWNPAPPATNTYTIAKADQVITDFLPADEPPFLVSDTATLSATATSGLAVSFSVLNGPGSISGGNTLTFTGSGTVQVEASQSGNSAWNAATPEIHTYTVLKTDQTIISFTPSDGTIFAATDTTNLSATASSGLPVSFSVVSGPGVISGEDSLYFTSTGAVAVVAFQNGDEHWNPTPPITYTYNVGKNDQTITGFTPPTGTAFLVGEKTDLSATASSGLPVEFRVISGPGLITFGNTLSFTDAGTVEVEAYQDGSDVWNAAVPVTHTYTVGKSDQSILSFTPADGTAFLISDTTNLVGTSSSGLPVYSRVVSGPGTLIGNSLRFNAAGAVAVEASQPGNTEWNAAIPVTNTYAVSLQEQEIQNFTPTNNTPFAVGETTTLSAAASSSLPVSFDVISGAGTLVGNQLSFSAIGAVAVAATQSGNAEWEAAVPVTNTYSVTKAEQTISAFLPATGSSFQHTATTNLSATASSGLPVSFAVISGPGSLAGNTLSFSGTGTVQVEASQGGNDNWFAAPPVTNTYTVSAGNQIITDFLPQTLAVFHTTNTPTLSATASSGLDVGFRVILGPGVIDTNTWTLSFTNAGSVRVEATQPGDADWNPAVPVTNAYSVGKNDATVMISNTNQVYTGSPISADTSTSPAGLPLLVAYEIGGRWGAELPIDAGTYGVAAGIDEDPVYQGYTQSILTISKANQTISGFAPADGSSFLVTNTVFLTATASSGLNTQFSVISGPASVLGGNNLIFHDVGTVKVTASQGGNRNWNTAPTLTNTYTVTKADQTIVGFTPEDGTAFHVNQLAALEATATSGLEVAFSIASGPGFIAQGDLLSFTGTGTVQVAAAQSGNADWNAAPSITNSYLVSRQDQVIDSFMPANGSMFATTNTPTLTAKASSGLVVGFAVVSGPATLVGDDELHFTDGGPVKVAAIQNGNSFWNAAAPMTNTYSVSKVDQTIIHFTPTNGSSFLVSETATLDATATSGLSVSFRVITGPGTIRDKNHLIFSGTGTVAVEAFQPGKDFWNAAAPVTNTYTVVQEDQILSGFTPTNGTVLVTTNTVALAASASSGLSVGFRVVSGLGSISGGNVLRFSGAGTVEVEASQGGNAEWNSAPPLTNTYTVIKAGQAITGFTPTDGSTFLNTDTPTLAATSSSGRNVAFVLVSGPGVIGGGNTLFFSDAGTVEVAAFQSGDEIWSDATAITNSYTVTKADQVISGFIPVSGTEFRTIEHTNLTASASSGLPVLFNIVSGPGLITGGTRLSFYGAGTVQVAAAQPGNADWNAAPSLTNSYTVTKSPAEVTLLHTEQAYDGGPHPVSTLTHPPELTVDLTYDGSVAPTNVGSYEVIGTVDDPYYSGSTTNTLTISAGNQVIADFLPQTLAVFQTTDAPTLSAAASSGLDVGFRVILGPGVIDTNTWTLSFTNAGSVRVEATQPGDADWNPAAPVTNAYSVGKVDATVMISNTNQVYTGSPISADTSTSPTGLPLLVAYEIGGRWSTALPIDAGTYGVAAGIDEDPVYQGYTQSLLTISKANQTISGFTPADGSTFLITNTVDLAADATSILPVKFSVISGPAYVIGENSLVFDSVGTVKVTASQGGNRNWNTAPPLTNSYTVLNSLPIFTSAPVTSVNQGEAYSYIVTTDDIDDDTVFVTATGLPNWLTMDRLALGTYDLNGTPRNANVGTHSVMLTATDGNGGSATQRFSIVVGNVNDAPIFISTPLPLASVDVVYDYTPTAIDLDGDLVTLTAPTLPGWMTFDGSLLTGTPTLGDLGAHLTEIIASDGNGGTATQSFEVVVYENPPPIPINAVNITASQFLARWKPKDGAPEVLNYFLDVSTSTNFTKMIAGYDDLDVGNVTDYLVADLTEGETYYYQLRALYETGLSADSIPSEGVLVSDNSPYVPGDYTNSVVSVNSSDYFTFPELFNAYGLTVTVVSNSDPTKVEVNFGDGFLTLNYLELGQATVVLKATASSGAQANLTIELTIVPEPQITNLGPVTFNRQNGLFEQSVTVLNISTLAADTVTLTVTNLSPNTTLYNQSGTDADGNPVVKWSGILLPGAEKTLILQYYTPDRGTTPYSTVMASLSLIPPSRLLEGLIPIAITIDPTASGINALGEMVIEFNSVPGETYYIHYTENLSNPDSWRLAYPAIQAVSTKTQWIDHGPPATVSLPGSSRFYQIIQFGE